MTRVYLPSSILQADVTKNNLMSYYSHLKWKINVKLSDLMKSKAVKKKKIMGNVKSFNTDQD